MLVFIDDSGDPGFNVEKGASKIFVIVCVIFDDELEAEKTAVAIKELKRRLGFSENVEFKFNGSSYKTRVAFLGAVNPFSFKIRSLVVDKKFVRSNQLKNDKNSFYSYFIKTALKYNKGTITDAKVRIDGSGDRLFRKQLLTYLRKELNANNRKITKNLRLIDSKSNVLIQMADMIAGTVRRYKEGVKNDAKEYWSLIQHKISDCWDFK